MWRLFRLNMGDCKLLEQQQMTAAVLKANTG